MLGPDTYRPGTDRYRFHDWRFGKDGVPHPATCGTCGRKTDGGFVSPAFRVKKRRRDITATYDGYTIISRRFLDLCVENGWGSDHVVPLPGDAQFYWLRPSRVLEFDGTTTKPCPQCHEFYDVIGPRPRFCEGLNRPLPEGFYRSDLEFGSGPEQRPTVVVGARTGDALFGAGLSGLVLSPLKSQSAGSMP
jgi:hypothetical protein